MAMRTFNVTLPADTNYRSLYTLLQAMSGWSPANVYTPWKGYELILQNGATAINVGDSNSPTVAGTPLAANGQLVFRAPTNSVSLRDVYVSGNSAPISGWFSWT